MDKERILDWAKMSGEDVRSFNSPLSPAFPETVNPYIYIYMRQACLSLTQYALSALGLVALPLISSASEEPLERRSLPSEALEEDDDPPAPAPLWGIGTSPGM